MILPPLRGGVSGKTHQSNGKVEFCAIRRLRTQCGRAKCALYSSTQATIEVDSRIGGVDYSGALSRARIDEPNLDYCIISVDLVEKCLRDSALDKEDRSRGCDGL